MRFKRLRQSALRYRIERALAGLLPPSFTYADSLTTTGRSALIKLLVGALGVAIGLGGIVAVAGSFWREILGGAAVAWGSSLITWALLSHRQSISQLRAEVRRAAETDLILARLNQLSAAVGAPLLDLDTEFEPAVVSREERLAHYGGLDELRPVDAQLDYSFWTREAMGRRP